MMKLSHLFLGILGLVIAPGLATAQFYQQDFSATFPPPVDNPGRVTVILTNESGDTIIPYENYAVPGFTSYDGRPQVAARTGGANANQEISAITSVYTTGNQDTTVQYEIDPLPATGGNGVYEPDRNLDDNFITLSEDGIGGVVSAVAWDQQFSGNYTSANHTFAFRISGTGVQANDQADGMAWAYLNSALHGTSGVSGPGTSEEPNFAGSLGVGFDIWDNGGEGGNSISLHYDGQLLENIPIDPGTVNPNTQQDWEFNSFETDEIITATIVASPGEAANTQVVLKGGSAYSVNTFGGRPSELIQVGGPESMEGYLRIVEEATGVTNLVAFDYDGSGASNEYNISFEFRGLTEDGTRADGMSFVLAPVELYGETGASQIPAFTPAMEEPNLAGAFGVGFDTFNSDADAQDDPEGMANIGNHVSIHFDGAKLAQENLATSDVNLVTNDPNVWHTASITISGDDVSVIVTDGVDGSEHVAFAGTVNGLSSMGAVRPVFAARTGGEFDHYEIDNFLMTGAGGGIRGDFNNDGVLDASDINALTAASASGGNQTLYDLNNDGLVNVADVNTWITAGDIYNSYSGDANLDREFNSGDLVTLFVAGKYETGNPAVWTEGDFNGDGVFNTGDFVTALSGGGYEVGPRAAVSAVPEPGSATLLLLGSLMFVRRRRK
jgi:hypothetical protein